MSTCSRRKKKWTPRSRRCSTRCTSPTGDVLLTPARAHTLLDIRYKCIPRWKSHALVACVCGWMYECMWESVCMYENVCTCAFVCVRVHAYANVLVRERDSVSVQNREWWIYCPTDRRVKKKQKRKPKEVRKLLWNFPLLPSKQHLNVTTVEQTHAMGERRANFLDSRK